MKKFIFIIAFGMLFSCSNETEKAQASADAAVIKLMKTPDKSTLSQSEIRKIVNYLDKNPEDSKYLMTNDTSKYMPVMNSNSKNSAKTTGYRISDYMQIRIVPTNGPDYGASVEILDNNFDPKTVNHR